MRFMVAAVFFVSNLSVCRSHRSSGIFLLMTHARTHASTQARTHKVHGTYEHTQLFTHAHGQLSLHTLSPFSGQSLSESDDPLLSLLLSSESEE